MAFQVPVTGSISATNYIVGDNHNMVVGGFYITSAAILGTLTTTFRWVEGGVSLTHIETMLLTVLQNAKAFNFPVWPDVNTFVTYECALTGLTGTFSCLLHCAEIGI